MDLLVGLNRVLGVIPAVLWALACALLAAANVGQYRLWESAAAERDSVKLQMSETLGGVKWQKAEAGRRLAALTDEVKRQQAELDSRQAAQETKDAQAKQTIGRLERELRSMSRAGGGGGLRDPNAAPCRPGGGGGAAEAAAAGAPADRVGDPPEAGGLVSAPLEGLLLELTLEADRVNAAYRSCRADAMTVRGRAPLPAD